MTANRGGATTLAACVGNLPSKEMFVCSSVCWDYAGKHGIGSSFQNIPGMMFSQQRLPVPGNKKHTLEIQQWLLAYDLVRVYMCMDTFSKGVHRGGSLLDAGGAKQPAKNAEKANMRQKTRNTASRLQG